MLARFQNHDLEPDEKKVVENVEKYGWHVVLIKDEPGKTSWAFTVGLFETYQHPEVAIFGLKPDTRGRILNWIGENISKGKYFTAEQEHDWVFDGYKCWSRTVQKKWYYDLFGYARWFYQSSDFPFVQCIWPAKDGIYPWEQHGYSSSQPLLYEEDLLKARAMHFVDDSELLKTEWPFTFDPHMQVFVSRCVVEDHAPIVRVLNGRDGDWQFLGPVDDPNEDSCKVSCFHCIVERDLSLRTLAALPAGWLAWREDASGPWNWEEEKEEDDPEKG